MMPQKSHPPGMDCPECKTFVVMPIEKIISASVFACPNPECSVELKLDAQRSSQSLDVLEKYAAAMKNIGQ